MGLAICMPLNVTTDKTKATTKDVLSFSKAILYKV
jgi:hypothetical protein